MNHARQPHPALHNGRGADLREAIEQRSARCSDFLLHPPEPLSLRLASNLMVGVSRVYGQQVNFYASDVSAVLVQLKYSFSQALEASATKLVGQARLENITLSTNQPGPVQHRPSILCTAGRPGRGSARAHFINSVSRSCKREAVRAPPQSI